MKIESSRGEVADDPTRVVERDRASVVGRTTPPEAPPVSAASVDIDSALTSLHGFVDAELEHLDPADSRGRAVLLVALTEIERVVRDDDERARARASEAFAADKTSAAAAEARRRYAYQDADWAAYVKALDAELASVLDDTYRVVLFVRRAMLAAQVEKDTPTAVRCLLDAQRIAPAAEWPVLLLRRLFAQNGDYEQLLEMLRVLIGRATSDSWRALLLVEAAELAERFTKQPQQAEEFYARALIENPSSHKAYSALSRLYAAAQRWQELCTLLVEHAPSDDKIESYGDIYRAARIAEHRLGDSQRATDLMEQVIEPSGGAALALQSLADLYLRCGRYADAAKLLARRVERCESPRQRAALAVQLGDIYRSRLRLETEAGGAYQQAIESVPGHPRASAALIDLYESAGRWADLVALILQDAECCSDQKLRAAGYLWAAAICERELEDVDRAVELYLRAQQLMPGVFAAFFALDRCFRRTEAWFELIDLYVAQSQVSDDGAFKGMLLRAAAQIAEEKAGDSQRAIALLEKSANYQAKVGSEGVFALWRLYRAQQRHEELRALLESWSEATTDRQLAQELCRQLAELYEVAFAKPRRAAELYAANVERDASDRFSFFRLRMLLRRAGQFEKLRDLLVAELARSKEAQRDLVALELGQLCDERLSDPGSALEYYRQASARPSLLDVDRLIDEILCRTGQYEQLHSGLSARAHKVEGEQAARLWCAAAEVAEFHLGDLARAAEAYSRAVSADGSCAPARRGCEASFWAQRDWPALGAFYQRELEVIADAGQRARCYMKMAVLREFEVSDPLGAADAYEAAALCADRPIEPLHALAGLWRRRGDTERLVEVLYRLSEKDGARIDALRERAASAEFSADASKTGQLFEDIVALDATDALALAVCDVDLGLADDAALGLPLLEARLRGVLPTELAQPLQLRSALLRLGADEISPAIERLRGTLGADGSYLPAIRLLRKLVEHQKRWVEVVELLESEARVSADRIAATQALVKAARLVRRHLSDDRRARALLERAFAAAPADATAFGDLVDLIGQQGNYKDLVGVYRRHLDAIDDSHRPRLLNELSNVYLHHLDDPSAAVGVLNELLELAPEDIDALRACARLCDRLERYQDAQALFDRLAHLAVEEPELRYEARLRQAAIYQAHLGDAERAQMLLESLHQEAPGNRLVIARLLDLLRKRGEARRVVALLEQSLSEAEPADQVGYLVELAETYSRQVAGEGQSARGEKKALAALRRAIVCCVEHELPADRLLAYYAERDDYEGLAKMLAQAVGDLADRGGAQSIRLLRARLLIEHLDRPAEAEQEVAAVLSSDPHSVDARLLLAEILLKLGDDDRALVEFNRVVLESPERGVGFAGLADVFKRRGDLDRAALAAQAALVLGVDLAAADRSLADQVASGIGVALAAASSTPLDFVEYCNLIAHPEEPAVARDLLHELRPYLGELLQDLLPSATGSIPLADEDPLYSRCQALAAVYGLTAIRAASATSKGQPLARLVFAADKEVLLFDDKQARSAESAALRFAIGCELGRLFSGSHFLETTERSDRLLVVMVAASTMFGGGNAGVRVDEERVRNTAKTLARLVPRRARRALEPLARAFGELQQLDLSAWRRAAAESARRSGLLFAGDLRAAIAADRAAVSRRVDLLRYAVSPHLHEARSRLGLSA